MTLEIRSGGAIAVDPGTLREMAARLTQARAWVDSARAEAADAARTMRGLPLLSPTSWDLPGLQEQIARLGPELDDLAGRLRATADAYELVELRVRAELMRLWPTEGSAGERELRGIEERVAAMESANPAALAQADALLAQWRDGYGDEFVRQWSDAAAPLIGVSPAFVSLWLLPFLVRWQVGELGAGVVPAAARLTGVAEPVRVRRTSSGTATAPGGLEAAARRIPSGGDARVRVEKYTMPDGSRQFAVYLAGTHGGGGDAWDWRSNLQLYGGQRSSSFQAAADALERAGAGRGDVLHVFGFSQGAMIGARLAVEGGYEVETSVGFGSPVDAQAGPGTLAVAVRHADDPVAMLAGGGLAAGAGSPDSLVVERTYDAATGPREFTAPAHRLDAYAETAALVDASEDPRVGAVHATLHALSRAVDVQVTEYSATRVERD
ncbi:hypothetical protein [Microbacterium sp. Marseille-Q6965]|uniref:hypothetical protein n=1 Tax=Microbacterium sp. Marseille-Q6965 TaxID=2965072 RepID=UPI0021B8087D|nr:hypothetical protein [Microbacterium sp. Marseille-Q6965]